MTATDHSYDWPPLRDVIERYDLYAEKSLGQNFLLDSNITDKIARYAGDLGGATVFEIGPGPGGLTRSLLSESGAAHIYAIEYDMRAVTALQELVETAPERLSVLHADALETDLLALSDESGDRHIVANLPYNIATPLLIKWLKEIRTNPASYKSLVLMFQKEVAERITAAPGSKTYGRLSVMAQWLCKAECLFDLPPSVFVPPPKVTSTVVRLRPRPLDPGKQPDFSVMEALVKKAFGKRRKMIRSSLKTYRAYLDELGIEETLRPENLAVKEFVALARAIEQA